MEEVTAQWLFRFKVAKHDWSSPKQDVSTKTAYLNQITLRLNKGDSGSSSINCVNLNLFLLSDKRLVNDKATKG